MKTQFTLYFETMPKGTAQQKGVNRYTGRFYKKYSVSSAEKQFATALLKYRPKKPTDKPVRLTVWFGFDVKQKKLWGTYKPTRPDCDNYIKEFKDTMTKAGFWEDDSQVADERVIKTYSEKAFIFVIIEDLEDKSFPGVLEGGNR